MARLLYITNGLGGGLNASYEIARRLTAAGHTIDFLGHRDLADKVEAQGYSYTRLSVADAAMDELRTRIGQVGHLRSFPQAYALRQRVIASREVETKVAAHKPEGLLIDLETHYCVLATRSLGIPTVLKSDWFSLAKQPGIPPLYVEQELPRTWLERRKADGWWARAQAGRIALTTVGELKPEKLARRYAPFRYNTVSRRDLRAVARHRELRLRDLTSQWHHIRPHLYPDLPMVSSVAKELDFVTRPAANDHVIGPMIYRDRVENALPVDDRVRWSEFRDRNRASERPLIYCAFGTMLADTSQMLARVIAAVRSSGAWDLVIGLGGRTEQLSHVTDPNILVLDYAPQLDVLKSADAAIAHGGINTINECVAFGVPMVLERSGATDAPGNASRVAHHGIGVRADLASIDPAELKGHIQHVLTDDSMRRRVREMRSHFARYEDDQVAERTISRLLHDGVRTS